MLFIHFWKNLIRFQEPITVLIEFPRFVASNQLLKLTVIATFDPLTKSHDQPIKKVLEAKSLCFINPLATNQFHLHD